MENKLQSLLDQAKAALEDATGEIDGTEHPAIADLHSACVMLHAAIVELRNPDSAFSTTTTTAKTE